MYKKIWLLLIFAVFICGSGRAFGFKDVKSTHPAYPDVMRMVITYEAISGYPDDTFKGNKTITRAEFSKIMLNLFKYLEKKYEIPLAPAESTLRQVKFKDLKFKNWAYPYVRELVVRYKIISGYPDGTFKPNKTINRYELTSILAKALKRIYKRYGLTFGALENISFKDVSPKHWAAKDISLLVSLHILSGVKEKNQILFKGKAEVTRFSVAIAGSRLMLRSESEIEVLPKETLDTMRKIYKSEVQPTSQAKRGLKYKKVTLVTAEAPVSNVKKAVEIPSKPQAWISGGWGNIYENASGTSNWMGFNAAASYADVFKISLLSGNFEINGKYSFNQVNYFVPVGNNVVGALTNEHRVDLELNTIYPVVEFFGIQGKFLLGAKYIILSNQLAPTNFGGVNLGLVTSAKVFERNVLLKAFYSLPLARATLSPSVFGQPYQLLDYEASLDVNIFSVPLLLGYSGEIMNLSAGSNRLYNSFFVRYFLL